MDVSNRGFIQGDPIPGGYGGTIRAYESSGNTPGIWIQTKCPEPNRGHEPDAPIVEEATILIYLGEPLNNLIEQLTLLRDNHFLAGDDEDEETEDPDQWFYDLWNA